MRAIVVALVLLVSSTAPAASDWQDDENGAGFMLFNVGALQVNDMAGTGTRCAAVDASGNLLPMSVACGTGTVMSVTGSAPLICSPSSPAVTCSLTFDNSSLVAPSGTLEVGTVAAANVAASPGGIGFFNASAELASDPATFGWNDASLFATFGEAAAPAAPAATRLACWADSTGENWTCKSHGGVVTHGVQTQAGATNNFLTAVSSAGAVSIAQPSFTNLSGTMSLAQEPTIAAHTIIANGTGLSTQAAQTSIGTTMAFDGTAQLQCVGLRDGGGVNHVTTGTWGLSSVLGTDVSGNVAAEAQISCGQSEGPWTGDAAKSAGSCAVTIPTKGKVLVSATDPTVDYLDTKLESTTASIAVTHMLGPPEFVNLNVVTAGLYGSPQSAAFVYNYLGRAITAGFGALWAIPGPINGSDTDGNAYEMSVEFVPTAVRIVANVTCNTLSATGYSGVTFQVTKNGSNVAGAITPALAAGGGCPTPGIIRDSGAIAVTASAGDRFGMLPSGSNTGGGVFSASVTLYVYQ